jgi:hypothetical protein
MLGTGMRGVARLFQERKYLCIVYTDQLIFDQRKSWFYAEVSNRKTSQNSNWRAGFQLIIEILRQLASRIPMESCAPMAGLYWFPVRSNSISNIHFSAVDCPIGAQDSNQLSENWRPGNLESGNEHSIYKKLLTGFQIGILQGAKSFQLRPRFIKQNGNFEKSQNLKGRSEKFKNQ